MSQPDRPDDEPEADTNIGNFPNGLPRVVQGYNVIEGVMHIWHNGVETPIWSDHRITVEMGWAACTHESPKQAYVGGPIKIEHWHCGYERTSQDAFDTAVSIQKDLEEQGEYVPIYVRY